MAVYSLEVDPETGLPTWDYEMPANLPPEADVDQEME